MTYYAIFADWLQAAASGMKNNGAKFFPFNHHSPFHSWKGREALRPSATDDVSRGEASGGRGVGWRSPPHKNNKPETLAGFNLVALAVKSQFQRLIVSRQKNGCDGSFAFRQHKEFRAVCGVENGHQVKTMFQSEFVFGAFGVVSVAPIAANVAIKGAADFINRNRFESGGRDGGSAKIKFHGTG